MMISAIGASTAVKAFSACMQDPKIPSRITTTLPGRTESSHDNCDRGYSINSWRYDGPWWHMVAVSKDPRFMPYYDTDSLWQRLNSTAFTTPIIEEWSEYILEKLTTTQMRSGSAGVSRNVRALHECTSYNCRAAMLYANDEHLDAIVSLGLKRGLIQIPGA